MKEAEEIKRPQSKDFFSNVKEMNDAFLNEPKLYQFIQALDNYIDRLEENLSSPQEVGDEEIEAEAYEENVKDGNFKYAYDDEQATCFCEGAKWMRDKIFK